MNNLPTDDEFERMLVSTLDDMANEADTTLDFHAVRLAAAAQPAPRHTQPWVARSLVLVSAAAMLAGVFVIAGGTDENDVILRPAESSTTAPASTVTTVCVATERALGNDPTPDGPLVLSSPRMGQEFFVDTDDPVVISGTLSAAASLYVYVGPQLDNPPVNREDWTDITALVQPDGSFSLTPTQLSLEGGNSVTVEASIYEGSQARFFMGRAEYFGVTQQTCS